MDRTTLAQLKSQAQVLKVMAHPTRLFVLRVLSQQDASADTLCKLARTQPAMMAKHLALLQNCRLIAQVTREGQATFELNCGCILNFLQCLESGRAAAAAGEPKPPC